HLIASGAEFMGWGPGGISELANFVAAPVVGAIGGGGLRLGSALLRAGFEAALVAAPRAYAAGCGFCFVMFDTLEDRAENIFDHAEAWAVWAWKKARDGFQSWASAPSAPASPAPQPPSLSAPHAE